MKSKNHQESQQQISNRSEQYFQVWRNNISTISPIPEKGQTQNTKIQFDNIFQKQEKSHCKASKYIDSLNSSQMIAKRDNQASLHQQVLSLSVSQQQRRKESLQKVKNVLYEKFQRNSKLNASDQTSLKLGQISSYDFTVNLNNILNSGLENTNVNQQKLKNELNEKQNKQKLIFQVVGQIKAEFRDDQSVFKQSTGFLIAKNKVITAASNIYFQNKEASEMWFYLDDLFSVERKRFERKVVKCFLNQEWEFIKPQNKIQQNLVLLILQSNIELQNLVFCDINWSKQKLENPQNSSQKLIEINYQYIKHTNQLQNLTSQFKVDKKVQGLLIQNKKLNKGSKGSPVFLKRENNSSKNQCFYSLAGLIVGGDANTTVMIYFKHLQQTNQFNEQEMDILDNNNILILGVCKKYRQKKQINQINKNFQPNPEENQNQNQIPKEAEPKNKQLRVQNTQAVQPLPIPSNANIQTIQNQNALSMKKQQNQNSSNRSEEQKDQPDTDGQDEQFKKTKSKQLFEAKQNPFFFKRNQQQFILLEGKPIPVKETSENLNKNNSNNSNENQKISGSSIQKILNSKINSEQVCINLSTFTEPITIQFIDGLGRSYNVQISPQMTVKQLNYKLFSIQRSNKSYRWQQYSYSLNTLIYQDKQSYILLTGSDNKLKNYNIKETGSLKMVMTLRLRGG